MLDVDFLTEIVAFMFRDDHVCYLLCKYGVNCSSVQYDIISKINELLFTVLEHLPLSSKLINIMVKINLLMGDIN